MPFGLIAGAIAGGGSLLGSIFSSNAAKDAANIQAKSADAATQLQRDIFNQTTTNLAPFLTAGTTDLNLLQYLMGRGAPAYAGAGGQMGTGPGMGPGTGRPDYGMLTRSPLTPDAYRASPGFNFNLQAALDAVQNSAPGRTGALSGNMLRGLQETGQGLASSDYWNAYNAKASEQGNLFSRLFQLAGTGQNAAAQQGGFGAAFGQQAGSNIIGAGNALAAGTVGSANALTGGLNNLSTLALLLNRGGSSSGSSFWDSLFGSGGSGAAGGGVAGAGGFTDFSGGVGLPTLAFQGGY